MSSQDLVGQILRRRYRVESLAGHGGMAEVYRAYDLRRGYPVAIKVMREDFAEDPEFVRRFHLEADNLARLSHDNIVRFYSFEHEGSLAFMVMAFIEGKSLRRRLTEAGGPLPFAEVRSIIGQLALALNYARQEGVIH